MDELAAKGREWLDALRGQLGALQADQNQTRARLTALELKVESIRAQIEETERFVQALPSDAETARFEPEPLLEDEPGDTEDVPYDGTRASLKDVKIKNLTLGFPGAEKPEHV